MKNSNLILEKKFDYLKARPLMTVFENNPATHSQVSAAHLLEPTHYCIKEPTDTSLLLF
jgi:hypothetical protein